MSLCVETITIPAGRFWMGSHPGEAGAHEDEHPRHQVEVAPFQITRFPVTQRLYREIMGRSAGDPPGDDLPVNMVSWLESIEFCNRLSSAEGLRPAYTM